MRYYAAALTGVVHLHFLHVLHLLLAHRRHGIGLCQHDYCSMVEHPGHSSGSFDQPTQVSVAYMSTWDQIDLPDFGKQRL